MQKNGIENEAAHTKNPTPNLSSVANKLNFERSEPIMNWADYWDLGSTRFGSRLGCDHSQILRPLTGPCFFDPAQSNSRRSDGVGMTDAVKLAHRLPRDRRERAGWEIRAAVGVTVPTRDYTQRHFVEHLFQHRVSRVPCAPGINVRRVIHKMCWVRSRKQIGGPGAQLASTVAGDVPPCQPQSGAASTTMPGHFVSRRVAPERSQRF